jgi:polyribonucleotide nucleotidyltransferase
MPEPRSDVKPHAPRMIKLFIDREYIGAVIGPQGKIIQEIQRETGTTINIEEKNNQGEVGIFGVNKEGVDKALAWIKGIVSVPEVGEEYEATVKTIQPYGAFVEFLPGKQGLLHISEVSWKRLETLEGILNEGDVVKVKLTGTDPKTGKFKLSRKILLPKPEGMTEERRDRPEGDGERRDRPRFEGRGDRREGGGGNGQRREGGFRPQGGGIKPQNEAQGGEE